MPTVNLLSPRKTLCIVVLLILATHGTVLWTQQTPADATKNAAGQSEAAATPNSEEPEEDWSSLTAKQGLHPNEPQLVEQDDDQPEFIREFVTVQWRAGDPIHLFVIRPKGVSKPPVILYLYSFPSETDRFLNDEFCKFLTSNGFAAVGFVSALTGHRYHDRPLREWFVSNLQEGLGSSAHDVQMILDYLSTRGDLDMGRVGMFGDGSGATIAILAAVADPRIKVLDLLNPWGDWPNWLAKSTLISEEERSDYLKPEFLKEVAPLDPLRWLPELKGRVIRIQNVNGVTVTPDAVKEHIESATPSTVQIVHYENIKAFMKNASSGSGFDWIKSQVQRTAPAEQVVTGDSHKSKPSTEEKKNR